MNSLVQLQIKGAVAEIRIDNPPVNALSQPVRQGLKDCLEAALENKSVRAAVLVCSGRTFVAGADISEFGKPPVEPFLQDLFNQIEQSPVPIVAALHGSVLGGGLELALACHYRIAKTGSKLGLPEVTLGLIPGAGGTQRLPRVAGLEVALQMISSGRPVLAESEQGSAIIDQLCTDNTEHGLLEQALTLAADKIDLAVPRARDLPLLLDAQAESLLHNQCQRVQKTMSGQTAPISAIEAVEQGARLGFDAGLQTEAELFAQCKASAQSVAMRHAFFAERSCSKIAYANNNISPIPIDKVAVIGAGTMGTGIAMCFASAGFHVQLLELAQANLERGLEQIKERYLSSVKRGRISSDEMQACIGRISGTTDYKDLKQVDLVVEAAFESMEVKRQIFTRLDKVCRASAILATNTSYLDVDEIAATISRPNRVLGMHFFSPAHVMKLLEVVRGAQTDDQSLLTAMSLAKRIGKIACAVGVCYGFVGNRMYSCYGREANSLLLEGAAPSQIDQAMRQWGMAMGPMAVTDLSGIDIGYKARRERPDPSNDPLYFRAADLMVEHQRLGQKSGAGFYRYVDGVQQQDPEVDALLRAEADKLGIAQRQLGSEEIQNRLICALINEGAKILEQGIAARASDIDAIWLNGYGFPRWRGGPMCYADSMGLQEVLLRLQKLRQQQGETYWQIAPLLLHLAEQGSSFAAFDKNQTNA